MDVIWEQDKIHKPIWRATISSFHISQWSYPPFKIVLFYNLARNINLQRPLLKEKDLKSCFWYSLINGLYWLLWNSSCWVALLFNKCRFLFLQILLILISISATKHRWITKASNTLFILLVFLVLFDTPRNNSGSLAQNADVPLIYYS